MTANENPVSKAYAAYRPVLLVTVLFSAFVNLLMFVAPLYMMQVYDRVLASRNETTLLMLTIIAVSMLVLYGALEFTRSRILVRAGNRFDRVLAQPTFDTVVRLRALQSDSSSIQAIRDVDTVREFLTGQGILAFCDAPWVPIFVAVCFILHPYLGLVALAGGLLIFALALINELTTKDKLANANRSSIMATHQAQLSLRNSEVINALGMRSAIRNKWDDGHMTALGWQGVASDRAGAVMAVQKFVRMGLQVCILGTGAYLAIQREVSPGVMIAASIMMGRALAPVEQAVGSWKAFVSMRQASSRLRKMFDSLPSENELMELPAPIGNLSIENIVAGPPRSQKAVLKNVSFTALPGQITAVVGPSAAGKSTLARVLVNVWPTASGHVRIDGADLKHWDAEKLGQYIGYLPQDVELFSGTVAQNIARFSDVDEKKVIAAARLADVHDMIQKLPNGYDTEIGEGGETLSGGQRQRIALARAVYDDPVMVVLDEPNSNLDTAGEEALVSALRAMKEKKMTVVVITHKPNLLTIADNIIIMMDGAVQASGPREQILPKLMGPKVVNPAQAHPAQQNAHVRAAQ